MSENLDQEVLHHTMYVIPSGGATYRYQYILMGDGQDGLVVTKSRDGKQVSQKSVEGYKLDVILPMLHEYDKLMAKVKQKIHDPNHGTPESYLNRAKALHRDVVEAVWL